LKYAVQPRFSGDQDQYKWDIFTDRPGRAMINYSPSPRKVLHMWRVRAGRLLISNDKERHTLRCVAKAVCKPLLRHVARQAEVPRRTPDDRVQPAYHRL